MVASFTLPTFVSCTALSCMICIECSFDSFCMCFVKQQMCLTWLNLMLVWVVTLVTIFHFISPLFSQVKLIENMLLIYNENNLDEWQTLDDVKHILHIEWTGWELTWFPGHDEVSCKIIMECYSIYWSRNTVSQKQITSKDHPWSQFLQHILLM